MDIQSVDTPKVWIHVGKCVATAEAALSCWQRASIGPPTSRMREPPTVQHQNPQNIWLYIHGVIDLAMFQKQDCDPIFCSIIYKLLHLLNIFRMERDWQRDLVYSELVYSFIFKRERRVKAIWKDFIEKGSPASGGWNAGDMLFLEGLRQWVRLSYTSSKRVFASQHLICSFRRLSHWDVYLRQSAWSWTKSPPPSVMLLPISSSGMGTFWLC